MSWVTFELKRDSHGDRVYIIYAKEGGVFGTVRQTVNGDWTASVEGEESASYRLLENALDHMLEHKRYEPILSA